MSEEEKTFEQLMARVEEIIRFLQEGSAPLEEALARYEEGYRVLKQAGARLEQAQQRLEVLRKDVPDDEPPAD